MSDEDPVEVAERLLRKLEEEGKMAEKEKPPAQNREDLHPKIRAQIGLGSIIGVVIIVFGAIPQVADTLGIGLPAIATSVISMVLLIGRGYQKAGDGR